MIRVDKPIYRIWVPGSPKSFRKKGVALDRYKQIVRNAASKVISTPTRSNRIDIEIFFIEEISLRADVDNILKPILDALKGVVYYDDRQVRSVKATAFPKSEPYGMSGWMQRDVLERLEKEGSPEFLINVYHRFSTPGP